MTDIRKFFALSATVAFAVVTQVAFAQDDLDDLLKDLESETKTSAVQTEATAKVNEAEEKSEAKAEVVEKAAEEVAEAKAEVEAKVEEKAEEKAEVAEKAAEEGVTGEDVIDDAGNAIKTVHGKKSEYLAQIGKIYTEWKNGDATEESFAELADKYSEDTASTTNGGGKGGLIENVQIGQTVKPFEDWSFDSARKAGDVEIVESSYGYHLMYYVAAQEEPQWKMNIKTTLAEAQLDEIAESAEAEYKGTAQTGAGEGIAFKAAVTHVLDLHERYRGN